MTLYLETSQDVFVPFVGQALDGVVYGPGIETVWTQEELAEKGLYVVQDTAIPEDKFVTGTSVARVDGVVRWVYDLIDRPIPDLTMRQLRLGLVQSGYAPTFVQDLINTIPDALARGLAQIWYEESSLVAWDHQMTQSLMALAGIPEADAKTMWLAATQLEA